MRWFRSQEHVGIDMLEETNINGCDMVPPCLFKIDATVVTKLRPLARTESPLRLTPVLPPHRLASALYAPQQANLCAGIVRNYVNTTNCDRRKWTGQELRVHL